MYSATIQDRDLTFLWNSEFYGEWLDTWDIPEMLLIKGILLVLQVLNLRQELILSRGFIFLLRVKFICPQLSSSFRLFDGKLTVILQFRSNLWRDFLDKVCSSSLILQISFDFRLELSQSIDLHDHDSIWCDSSWRLVSYRIISELFPLPSFLVHCPLQLQRVFSERRILKSSTDFSFKVIMNVFDLQMQIFLNRM